MENIVNSTIALYKAYRKTRCGKRDNPTAMRYRMEAIERTVALSERLQRRDYSFGPYYPFKVYEPKERLVLAIDFEGKVVQHSLCDNVLEPAFSRRFIRDNYAGQIGKGTHDGLDRLAAAMRHYFFSRKAADEAARKGCRPAAPADERVGLRRRLGTEGAIFQSSFTPCSIPTVTKTARRGPERGLKDPDADRTSLSGWLLAHNRQHARPRASRSATSRANCSRCSIWTPSTTG